METILIVDDKKDNRYLLQILLQSKGYVVLEAENGAVALEQLATNSCDLIITDILMPVMDGFQLCQKLKEDTLLSTIPLIFYTATYTEKQDEEFGLGLGAHSFIRKPIDPHLFLRQIEDVLSGISSGGKPVADTVELYGEHAYKLYSERLVSKLEKKMLDLEEEVKRRQVVQAELEETRNLWQETFQAIPSPSLLLDEKFHILEVNRAALDKLSSSAEVLVGKTCYEVFHQSDGPIAGCPMERLLGSANDLSVEAKVEAFGGTYLINCAPLRGIGGEIERFIHIAVDINARKRVEERLQESEARFRKLVENIKELFWIREGASERITYLSPMFEPLFGIPKERMYSDPYAFMERVVPEDRPHVRDSHHQQLRLGRETDITYRIERDGELRWIRAKGYPVRDEEGKVSWVGGIAEDITEMHKVMAEQKELETQLLHAQKLEAVGTLAGGIAHDFNNLLSSIIGFTELAMGDIDPESQPFEDLQQVLAAGLRAKKLTAQILSMARQGDDEVKPVKISSVAEESLSLLRSTIPSNIVIQHSFESEGYVMACGTRIHQVFMNLLTNAAHAMRKNGGQLTITVRDVEIEKVPEGVGGARPGKHVSVEVRDTGEGIAQENLTDVFTPYFTTKDMGEGTGLGLSVSQGIVNQCGGWMTVVSSVGEGTTFTVFFPTIDKIGTISREKVGASELPSGSEHILIVDDEYAIVKMLGKRLERLGYSTTQCTSSVAALELFRNSPEKYDLLVSDITMPEITGDILALEFRQIREDIPIVLCTGYSQRVSEGMLRELNIEALLMKPVGIKELSRAVRKGLDKRG